MTSIEIFGKAFTSLCRFIHIP